MASASSLPCDEQFLCSICLDVFTEPVSTPCGHNYCKTCITGYWASSERTQCPLCLKKFRRRPQLQVNTEFRDMLEHFKNTKVRDEDNTLAEPGEVPCDICLVPKLKAQKTCLVCLASYCQPHLEPHERVAALKKHQLIDPVSNLEDRVCKKHDKVFELFCLDDQMCVCYLCSKDDHAAHQAVPLEHAFRERKDQLDYVTSEIKMMENTKFRSLIEIICLVEKSKNESEKEMADIAEVFTALLVSLQRSQAELIAVIQEKQKAALKQAADHVTQLGQEVDELRRRRSEMEQLLQTEDHLRLLQSWSSLSHTEDLLDPLSDSSAPLTPDLFDISQQCCLGMVKKAVAQMEKTLSNEMEELIHEVRLSYGCELPVGAERPMTDGFVKEVWTPPQYKLMKIRQLDAVDVTLDTYTAHSRLMVSEDGKQLRFGGFLSLPASFGRRFERQPLILGKEGFSSGRFYYEVRVSGSKGWVLGVVKEPFQRGSILFPMPEDGGWALCGIYNQDGECLINSFTPATLHVRRRHQTVGVFVDYEKGEVSFYDVDARTLIYSHSGCAFNKTNSSLKSFLHFMTGTSLSNGSKLYPIFGIFEDDYDSRLVITPVAHTTYTYHKGLYQW
ncbi:E3 ubiquitin-protein ligase TRIM39-like [Sebastes fasciatus]|uniref:E3 ubiquitin-protein ligase TRIM39-like n=1 Tax=Sebastes fasciatus TaxID=394691 RepID=UPI003D9E5585